MGALSLKRLFQELLDLERPQLWRLEHATHQQKETEVDLGTVYHL